MKRQILLVLLLFILAHFKAISQDIHYSQFYNAPFNINPGLTGIFSGDIRLMANYRSQWSSVPADFKTVTMGGDIKIRGAEISTGFFAVGFHFNYDQAGFTNLAHSNFSIPVSYTKRISRRFFTSVGFQLSSHQRRFSLKGISFDSQYTNPGGYDPNNPNNEVVNDLPNNNFIDFSAGINFRLQSLADNQLLYPQRNRSKLDFGLGVFHLTRPNQSFVEGGTLLLPIRISPYAYGTMMINPKLDLIGSLGAQVQDQYLEALAGISAKYHVSTDPGNEVAIQAGINLRFQDFGDAYSPTFELFYKNWRASFSYDVNISGFNAATRGNSGPEFSISYIIKKIPLLSPDNCRLL